MRQIALVLRLAPVDLKNIRRDSLLMWIPLLPFLLAWMLRTGVPPLTSALSAQTGLDITPWYPLIMSSFVITVAGTIGTVTGFLLLDERDDGVLDALLVTPLSPGALLAYRVATPLAVGFVLTMVAYPIAGLTPLPWRDLAAATALGSLSAPFMALCLASFGDNKVTGFALMKTINAVQVLPLVAYFVDPSWQIVFGFMPSYWPMKMVWLAADGEPYAAYLVAGILVNVVAVGLLLRRFDRVVHR